MASPEDDRAPELDKGSGAKRTRTETFDAAAMLRAVKDAFEAGASTSRAVLDSTTAALKDAYAEIGRLHGLSKGAIEKSQELVTRLQTVASQNVALALAEQNGRAQVAEIEQRGENLRHGLTLLVTNPYMGLVVNRLLPAIGVQPLRPPGEGNTPREAAERLAASLRSGSDGSKLLLDALKDYCAEELGRPDDLGLLLEFLAEAVGTDGAKSAPSANDAQGEAA